MPSVLRGERDGKCVDSPKMREYPTQQWKDEADEDAIVLERRQEAAVILLFETLVCGSGPSSAWAVFQLGDCPDVT